MCLFAKEVGFNRPRWFESSRLRSFKPIHVLFNMLKFSREKDYFNFDIIFIITPRCYIFMFSSLWKQFVSI